MGRSSTLQRCMIFSWPAQTICSLPVSSNLFYGFPINDAVIHPWVSYAQEHQSSLGLFRLAPAWLLCLILTSDWRNDNMRCTSGPISRISKQCIRYSFRFPLHLDPGLLSRKGVNFEYTAPNTSPEGGVNGNSLTFMRAFRFDMWNIVRSRVSSRDVVG